MLDLKTLRTDFAAISAALTKKGFTGDLAELLQLDDDRRADLQVVEGLRRRQNEENQRIAAASPAEKSKLIEDMKGVASELKVASERLARTEKVLTEKLLGVPNPPHESVPEGGEDDFVVVKTVGEPRQFAFPPRDHAELGTALDLIDTARGAKVSGSRFYYLKNDAVLLEFALVQFILTKLIARGFTPMLTPTLVREAAMVGTGFFPADRNEIYHVNPKTAADPEGDDLYLAGTSEVPLTMYHSDEILDVSTPRRYVGFSTCYRREAGTYGKDTKGIFRVHQFDKLEMFSFCNPENSWEEHELIRSLEEEILTELGLPFRVINIAGGDLGMPAAKKYDCEVFLPSEGRYRELTSCSNCTDYQARRANVRYRTTDGATAFVHTLNGTACAMTRMLVAILENYQEADGSVRVPDVLQKYIGKKLLTK